MKCDDAAAMNILAPNLIPKRVDYLTDIFQLIPTFKKKR